MPEIRHGSTQIIRVYHGSMPIKEIRRGSVLIWSSDNYGIHDEFNGSGVLSPWVNSNLGGAGAGWGGVANTFFSDGLIGLVNQAGSIVGQLVGFVPDLGGTGLGSLLSPVPGFNLGALSGTIPSGGSGDIFGLILGFLNGIPIIGDLIPDDLTDVTDITSLLGQIPVLGQLGTMIGLTGGAGGAVGDPTNFLVGDDGLVLGVLSGNLISQFIPHSGTTRQVRYVIGQNDGYARVLIPDGLVALEKQTARFHHPSDLADDGWLEVRVTALGSANHVTQVFRRASTDGNNGVGIDLRNSSVCLYKRVGGVDSSVTTAVGVNAGDRLRTSQVGNQHTLLKNGLVVGSWNDASSTAHKGSGYRKVQIRMDGGKDLLGPRRYSPSLDYLDAG